MKASESQSVTCWKGNSNVRQHSSGSSVLATYFSLKKLFLFYQKKCIHGVQHENDLKRLLQLSLISNLTSIITFSEMSWRNHSQSFMTTTYLLSMTIHILMDKT